MPHMVLGDTIEAATEFIIELYGTFLRDTDQEACRMNFLLERYTLEGSFKDVTDREVFPACYTGTDHTVPQQVASDVAASDSSGLLYDSSKGLIAVVTKAKALKWHGRERALALEWNGTHFTRMFDYRDLHWRGMGEKK